MDAEIKAPAEVLQDQGRGGAYRRDNDESTARKQKRQLKNVWYEEGRFLFCYSPNGSTVFDTWKWFGEPLHRGHA